jgi:hypothetical protein
LYSTVKVLDLGELLRYNIKNDIFIICFTLNTVNLSNRRRAMNHWGGTFYMEQIKGYPAVANRVTDMRSQNSRI